MKRFLHIIGSVPVALALVACGVILVLSVLLLLAAALALRKNALKPAKSTK